MTTATDELREAYNLFSNTRSDFVDREVKLALRGKGHSAEGPR